jgi:predicted metal-binding membrane protein
MRFCVVLGSFARPPWPWLFAVAILGATLSSQAGHGVLPTICGSSSAGLILAVGWAGAIDLITALSQPSQLIAEWMLMLLAMMPPLLAAPMCHVWRSNPRRLRARGLLLFVLGYLTVWIAAGPVLVILSLLLVLLTGYATAFAVTGLMALAWSASPWQRRALNNSHRMPRIGIFGWSSYRDCLAFGATHGMWCIASCWAWMLLPLAAGVWHWPAMVFAGALMLAERLAPPSMPRWRLPALLSASSLSASLARPTFGFRYG